MSVHISPSILSADFGNLNEEIRTIEDHADCLHIDVMDGHFVPNLTFGAPVVKCIKSKLPLDCHLMISNPEKYFEEFADAGASSITFHIETVENPDILIRDIKRKNCRVGISLKPKTTVHALKEFLPIIDLVLVMTVEPGFGGQSFMEDQVSKISDIRSINKDISIHVDGGINAETAKKCIEAGADTLVAGSYIFGAEDRIKAIESLRH